MQRNLTFADLNAAFQVVAAKAVEIEDHNAIMSKRFNISESLNIETQKNLVV